MMKNFTILCTILSLFVCTTVFTQNYYYAPEGKTHLKTSTDKILIKFKAGTDYETQKQILGNKENLNPLERENLLPAPDITLVNLTNETEESNIETLLDELESHDLVEYANHFLASKDGALHGIMDKVIVGLKHESDAPTLESIARGFGAAVESRNDFDKLMYHLVVAPGSERNALEVANSLFETGLFAFAEPDFLRIMKKFNTNDTYVNDQWSLNNDGNNTSQWNGIAGSDMKVFSAWNTSTGSSSISVAIIDEGVDLAHPDLAANMLPGFDATGQNSGGAPSGNDAHGTACAGIVAAVGNNNLGIAGVAYSSKIVPVRIAYDDGNGNWITSNTWIANGMNWAYQTGGADILSNSWGGGSSSSAINGAITGARTNGRGGLGSPVLFSAGNGNGAVNYPANNNETIAVIAMSMCDERKNPSSCDGETWWGSDYGTNADVTAPGVKIYATDISGSAGYSSGDYISNFNGTSSACPNAAGVMALILSVNGSLTETAARAALETTCDKAGNYTYNNNVPGQPNGSWASEMGYGRINADAALNSLAPPTNDDAGISSIIAPSGTICATSAVPQVILKNFGANNLTSADIIYDVDGGSSSTHNWTGNLAPQATTTVTLSSVSFGGGAHTFNAATNNPNGTSDSNTNNDGASSNFNSGDQAITLTIVTDNYPAETTWDIRDASNNLIASGGPYAQSNTTFVHNLCVPGACHDLTIYDSYGDGLCCAYGNGSYSLTEDATGTVLASGGQFGSSETTNFCVPTAGPTQYTLTTNINGDGSVALNPPGGTYNAGTQVTLTATPNAGSQFDNWSGDASGSTNPLTVTVNSNMTITANFSVTGGGCTFVNIDTEDFESGWGIWNDGGSDAARINNATYANSGTYSIQLRDNTNTSVMTTDVYDWTGYDDIKVDFAYYVVSFDNSNEDFWLQISTDGGVSFTTVEEWNRDDEFVNNQQYNDSVTIPGPFTANTALRFRCDASGNQDWVYIDDVVISGCPGSGGPTQYNLTTSVNGNGSVALNPPGGTYNAGTQVTMTATADPGHQFDNWSGDASGSTNPITVTVNSNMNVTANFSPTGGGCTYVTVDDEDFEGGWGMWNDGGSDCRRSANDAAYASSGTYCIRLRDDDPNSSFMTTDNMDLSNYDELTVDFGYYVRSFEGTEDFWLQISTDGGATFTTEEDWVRTIDFNNDEFKTASVVIAGPFSSTTQLRFRCDASGNSDWVYIDDVLVTGCTTGPTGGNSEILVEENPKEEPASETIDVSFTELLLFPNPVADELTVAYKVATMEQVELIVTDFTGRILKILEVPGGVHQAHVDVSQMVQGYYLVHLISGKERTSKKFVVVK